MRTLTNELLEAARQRGRDTARKGTAGNAHREYPSNDWKMLDYWDSEKSLQDSEYNQPLYEAWLEGYRDEMKLLVECCCGGHRVPLEKSNLKEGYCDMCYVRHCASDEVIEKVVEHLLSEKKGASA